MCLAFFRRAAKAPSPCPGTLYVREATASCFSRQVQGRLTARETSLALGPFSSTILDQDRAPPRLFPMAACKLLPSVSPFTTYLKLHRPQTTLTFFSPERRLTKGVPVLAALTFRRTFFYILRRTVTPFAV